MTFKNFPVLSLLLFMLFGAGWCISVDYEINKRRYFVAIILQLLKLHGLQGSQVEHQSRTTNLNKGKIILPSLLLKSQGMVKMRSRLGNRVSSMLPHIRNTGDNSKR